MPGTTVTTVGGKTTVCVPNGASLTFGFGSLVVTMF